MSGAAGGVFRWARIWFSHMQYSGNHHIISYNFISFHFISFHFISFHFISYHIMSHHAMSCHIISYHVYFAGARQCVEGVEHVWRRGQPEWNGVVAQPQRLTNHLQAAVRPCGTTGTMRPVQQVRCDRYNGRSERQLAAFVVRWRRRSAGQSGCRVLVDGKCADGIKWN